MGFIQFKSGARMGEITGIPSGMTGNTVIAQFGDFLSGRVTGPAIQIIMIAIEGPAGRFMSKWRPFPIIMTFAAIIDTMAVITDGVNFFVGFCQGCWPLNIMTVTAIFFFMTIDATQPEKDYMLLMPERNNRSRSIRGPVYFRFRFGQYRMGYPDEISGIALAGGKGLPRRGRVAKNTFRIMTPFPVATETLPMIGTF
jgi:hypothetical protein